MMGKISRISTIAKNYANALIEIEDAGAELDVVSEILKSSPDLVSALVSPAIPEAQKSAVIDEVFSKDISPKMVEFLKILINKNRFKEFDGIVAAYKGAIDKTKNIAHVEVVSAVELNDKAKEKITAKLTQKLNKTIQTQWSLNPEIIAGLVVKIGDDVIDASVKSKIDQLEKALV